MTIFVSYNDRKSTLIEAKEGLGEIIFLFLFLLKCRNGWLKRNEGERKNNLPLMGAEPIYIGLTAHESSYIS